MWITPKKLSWVICHCSQSYSPSRIWQETNLISGQVMTKPRHWGMLSIVPVSNIAKEPTSNNGNHEMMTLPVTDRRTNDWLLEDGGH